MGVHQVHSFQRRQNARAVKIIASGTHSSAPTITPPRATARASVAHEILESATCVSAMLDRGLWTADLVAQNRSQSQTELSIKTFVDQGPG